MFHRLFALSLVLILVACTQAPQPLRHSRTGFDPSGLRLRDGGTIFIQPIEGIAKPLAQIMGTSLAESLGARGIPSTSNLITNPSYKVRGQVVIKRNRRNPHITGAIYWTFAKRESGEKLEYSQPINVERHRWEYGDQALIDNLVEAAADEFASYLQDNREREAVELAVRDQDVVFFIDKIDGAPGDGANALKKAMTLTLRQAGALVRNKPSKNGYILDAEVRALDPFEGKQRIKIAWIVKDPTGHELGRAQLNNQLDEGRLNKPWGRLAYEISRAAVQSIGLMVERHRSEAQFDRSRTSIGTTAAPGRRNRRFIAPY